METSMVLDSVPSWLIISSIYVNLLEALKSKEGPGCLLEFTEITEVSNIFPQICLAPSV